MLEKVNTIIKNMEVKEKKLIEILSDNEDENLLDVFRSYIDSVNNYKKIMYDGATMLDQINYRTNNMDERLTEMIKQLDK